MTEEQLKQRTKQFALRIITASRMTASRSLQSKIENRKSKMTEGS